MLSLTEVAAFGVAVLVGSSSDFISDLMEGPTEDVRTLAEVLRVCGVKVSSGDGERLL